MRRLLWQGASHGARSRHYSSHSEGHGLAPTSSCCCRAPLADTKFVTQFKPVHPAPAVLTCQPIAPAINPPFETRAKKKHLEGSSEAQDGQGYHCRPRQVPQSPRQITHPIPAVSWRQVSATFLSRSPAFFSKPVSSLPSTLKHKAS